MKKKVILLSLTCSIICIGAIIGITYLNDNSKLIKTASSTNNYEFDTHTYITEEIKSKAESNVVSALFDKTIEPANLKDQADNIAIVRMISLDASNAKYDTVVGNSYGKMLINTVIKGDLSNGQVIEYASTGGYLTIAEWEKNQPAAANEKRDYLRAQSGIEIDKNKTYIHLQFDNSIDVEPGKTYLAYFNYNEDMGKYEIIGFQNGLMELDIPQSSKVSAINLNTNELKILNNTTKQYENLEEYITENID